MVFYNQDIFYPKKVHAQIRCIAMFTHDAFNQ